MKSTASFSKRFMSVHICLEASFCFQLEETAIKSRVHYNFLLLTTISLNSGAQVCSKVCKRTPKVRRQGLSKGESARALQKGRRQGHSQGQVW